ncbi:hypothetical protein A2U01_0119285, partial [Trifolium medium]|nr:hypothetical protein [Trifolium medium]
TERPSPKPPDMEVSAATT